MTGSLIDVFADDSVLLVFVVMAVAAALGAIRFRGIALGPAAALFAGLGVGAVAGVDVDPLGLAQAHCVRIVPGHGHHAHGGQRSGGVLPIRFAHLASGAVIWTTAHREVGFAMSTPAQSQ